MPRYNPVEDFLYRAKRLTPEQRQAVLLELAGLNTDEQEEARRLGEIMPLMEGTSFEEVEEQVRKGDTVEGFTTGYWTLDRMTAGLVPGELIVISGESGFGKTNLCVNMASRQLANGLKVLIISLENTAKSIRRRMRLIMGEVYFPLLVGEDNIFIQKHPEFSRESIKFAIENAKKKEVQVVYIDHLQFLQEGNDNAAEEIGSIVKECKQLSQQFEVPIVLVSQLTKGTVGEKVSVHDLYGSVKIRQFADIILLGDLDPNNPYTPHLRVTVHKQRDRVLWRRYSSVTLTQTSFNLEEPSYSEELDRNNDITGQPRGKGSSPLTFRE